MPSTPLTPAQRYHGDLARLASRIPWAAVERTFELSPVAAARETAVARPSWAALFAKALAFVAAARPELRQLYQRFPWPHLYQHPHTVAVVAVERTLDDEWPELWARLRAPEEKGLVEIESWLERAREEPLDSLAEGHRAISRLTWCREALSARRRARHLGTVAVASLGEHATDYCDPLYPATAVLTFGPIAADGRVTVRLRFDARVLTARTAADVLNQTERALRCEILLELRYFQKLDAA